MSTAEIVRGQQYRVGFCVVVDRAVLDAYGWAHTRPTCQFELEWEDEDAENGRRCKKAWRYRWPEQVRDEVLARFLALNAQRAEEERPAAFSDL